MLELKGHMETLARTLCLSTFFFLGSGIAFAGPVPGLDLTWPVPTGFTLKPGQDYAQFNDGSANRHHSGIDIPAPVGTQVVAAAAGTARVETLAANNDMTRCLGNVVVIDHGGMGATLYAHLDTVEDIDDTFVSVGDPIGTVGTTLGNLASGGSCGSIGAHLHFEVKDNAVLGNVSDDGVTWGYTPEPGVVGSPVPADHPDAWGYHDPIQNLHPGIVGNLSSTVEVTELGTGVSHRAGPDVSYRGIGSSLQAGQQFRLIGARPAATSGCSGGWFQLENMASTYFPDSVSGGSLPDVWACSGNAGEQWIADTGVGCLSGNNSGPVLHVHDSLGRLASINLNLGGDDLTVAIIGQMSAVMTDIAFDGNGRLFATDFDALYEVNPFDGTTELIGSHGVAGANALVVSPDGETMYLAGFSDSFLYLINPSDASATPVGDIGSFSAGDLAFVGSQLYMSSTEGDLVAVDPDASGVIGTRVGPIGFQDVFGLATASNGVLYGVAGTEVFSVSTQTGNGTLINEFSGTGLSETYGSSFLDEAGGDADCDGLWDSWEIDGLTTDDGVFVDFPAMGADQHRADIFIQIDRMEGILPRKSALDAVVQAFDDSPYQPPNCSECRSGISLHLDAGPDYVMNAESGQLWGDMSEANELPAVESLGDVTTVDDSEIYNFVCDGNSSCLDDYKTPDNFSAARRQGFFHYALYAIEKTGRPASGISRGITARDFIIFTYKGDSRALDEVEERTTFMHELGHNLGLRHGGAEDETYKPNYLSIMNYNFSLSGLETPDGSGGLDFSHIVLPTLFENTLNEVPLVSSGSPLADYKTRYWCEGGWTILNYRFGARDVPMSEPVNWNCNDEIDAVTVAADINRSEDDAKTDLVGYNDWANLKFAGGAVAALNGGLPLPPQPDAVVNAEEDIERLREIPSTDGVRLIRPADVIRSIDGLISISLTNKGTRPAMYSITVEASDGQLDPTLPLETVNVDAEETVSVQIDIGDPGTQELSSTLAVTAQDRNNTLIVDSISLVAVLEAAPPPPPAPPPDTGSGGGGGAMGLLAFAFLLAIVAKRRRRTTIRGRRIVTVGTLI